MYHCSRGPLAASACFVFVAPLAMAQNDGEAQICDNQCQADCDRQLCDTTCTSGAMGTRTLCNADLAGVQNWVSAVYTRDADGNCEVVRERTPARRLCTPNLAVAAILNQLDIDGDGIPDNSPDTDGDGLPDNWETGGLEAPNASGEDVDRVVFYPAPTAIVPGTPPTPIFTRLAVATSALDPDTDGDGLSDYIEVFGLKYIDENGNGLFDDLRAPGSPRGGLDTLEWNDLNGDGLPSPGEHPIDNTLTQELRQLLGMLHDFDGFVFTDPTNSDTDGDGVPDGADSDPLINLRAFGITGPFHIRFRIQNNPDIDQDGLGNAMDVGNDLTTADGAGLDFEAIDNPESITDLLDLFRRDLLEERPRPVLPESQSEDLLGADWDGNGLWRMTDVRTWHIVIGDPSVGSLSDPETIPPDDLFDVGGHKLYAAQSLEQVQAVFNDPQYDVYGGTVQGVGDRSGGRSRIGMGWQNLLQPSGKTQFLPDERVWAILYSWRMPGFDIDGDGFVGVPNPTNTAGSEDLVSAFLRRASETAPYQLDGDATTAQIEETNGRAFDDLIEVWQGAESTSTGPSLNGVIEAPPELALCGTIAPPTILLLVAGLVAPRCVRRRRSPQQGKARQSG
ncbi:MAG: hypothetical protein ACE5HE_12255 [Phycisphaerae bacterium]